jgi:hypothetical protein
MHKIVTTIFNKYILGFTLNFLPADNVSLHSVLGSRVLCVRTALFKCQKSMLRIQIRSDAEVFVHV